MSSPSFDMVAAAFEAVGGRRLHDGSYRGACIAHGGDNPSALSLSEGTDGRALVYCFTRGCDWRDILAALGFERHKRGPQMPQQREAYARRQRTLARLDGDKSEVLAFLGICLAEKHAELCEAQSEDEAIACARAVIDIETAIGRIATMSPDERRRSYARRVLGVSV
jgi:transposase